MNDLINRVNELLSFNPETGLFVWKITRGSAAASSKVGCDNGAGYLRVRIDNKLYYLHRLAFLLTHGFIPKYVDHINHDTHDNRPINIREATHSQNNHNMQKGIKNTSGHKGVSWCSTRSKWIGSVKMNGKTAWKKSFSCIEEAVAARSEAAKKIHGEFFCNG